MKRKTNNNRRNQRRNAPSLQLSRRTNIFSSNTSAYVNISYPVFVYGYQPSALYSFSGSADIRSISFSTIISGTEFTNLASVYRNYRIKSLSVIVTPMELTTYMPILYCGVNPEGTGGNPTNSNFILSDKAHIFSPVSNGCRSVTFSIPGVGISTNIWSPVTSTHNGEFIIGNNTVNGLFTSTAFAWDCQLSLLCEFNNAV